MSTASLKGRWSLPCHRLQAGDWSGCRRGWILTRFDVCWRHATAPLARLPGHRHSDHAGPSRPAVGRSRQAPAGRYRLASRRDLVRGKANCTERIPLPPDVGQAVAEYLQRGRPVSAQGRTVFVRIKAPHRDLSSCGVSNVVADAADGPGSGESMRIGCATQPRYRCCGLGRRCRRSANSCVTAVL